MKLFKSEIFVVGILPGIILSIWLLIAFLSINKAVTIENTAATLAANSGILNIWKSIRYFAYISYTFYLIFSLVKLFMASKSGKKEAGKPSIKRVVGIYIIGMVFVTFSFLIGAVLYDLFRFQIFYS